MKVLNRIAKEHSKSSAGKEKNCLFLAGLFVVCSDPRSQHCDFVVLF